MRKTLKVVAFGGGPTDGGNAPINTVAPVISGSTSLGSVLTTTNGTWTSLTTITYTYQWYRGINAISGATSSTYTLVAADSTQSITCQVTATNVLGAATATSNTITAGNYAPINTVAPVISGSTTLGSLLSCTTGTWTGAPTITYTYQWYRGASSISGATSSTYTLVAADSTQSITCQVTATNILGDSTATSNIITAGNYAPINTVAPVISGTNGLNSILTATSGTWTGAPTITYTYQWKRNGIDILGATSNTYTILVTDSAANLTCQVTATNSVGSSSATSNTITAQTFSAPVNTVAPAITGTAQEGQTLTCSTGTWTGNPTPTYAYQWKCNDVNIGSATNSTYTLVTADVGQSIKCTVTATNAVGSASADSNTVTPTASTDADAQAFITAANITDSTQQTAINTLVTDLKSNNLWTKMKALYPMVGGTATSHSYNLKNPSQFQITWNGGLTHDSNGVTGNGTNGYGNLNLNPRANLTTQYSFGTYCRVNNGNANQFDFGSTDQDGFNNYCSISQFASLNYNHFVPANGISISNTTTNAFFHVGLDTSNNLFSFKNTTLLKSQTPASIGTAPSKNTYLFGYNNNGTAMLFSARPSSLFFICENITQAENTTIYNIIQNYQTILSRNI